MSENIYCGIDKVPKGSRRGTMKECAEKGQIRYYGIKKVDPKIVETAKKHSRLRDETRESLVVKLMGTRGKVRSLKNKIADEKDPKEKKKLQKELDKMLNDLMKIEVKFSEFEKKRKASRIKTYRLSRSRKSRSRSRSRNNY